MRGVDAALQRLQPVALLPHLRAVPVAFRHLGPLESRRRRHPLAWSHIGPDHPAGLRRRVGRQADLVAELLRFVHLIDAVAVDVELPAMIDAAQARLFVAPEPQRGAPMGAEFIDEADAAPAVAKTDEALAEQPDTYRRAVRLGQFAREKRRDPVSPQHVTHRGSGPGPRHQLVVFACQHRCVPLFEMVGAAPGARPTRYSDKAIIGRFVAHGKCK